MKPSAYVLYQYMPPDEVVSAVHLGDLCAGLAERGWQVTAFPCNRACRNEQQHFAKSELWQDVAMRRIYRPRFCQSSSVGRLLNAFWMQAAWCLLALRPGSAPDVLIIGTDPMLSVLVAIFWRLFRPKTRVVHWCFDLYPEAAIADGLISEHSAGVRFLRFLLRRAYRSCHLLVDIGPCMRERLLAYDSAARRETLVPWALTEPAHPLAVDLAERGALFGQASLALLYSGTFGRAHSYEQILDLADRLQAFGGSVVFSIGGNCADKLKDEASRRNAPISFVPMAPQDRLQTRLACADVHIVSLRAEWTGMVVPSKFFGALSAGRPVLFLGSSQSAIARWIEQYQIGWVLDETNVDRVAVALQDYAHSLERQQAMHSRCWTTYGRFFAKEMQIGRWDAHLRGLLFESQAMDSISTRTRNGR